MLPFLAIAFLTGCYSLTPATYESVAPHERVRAVLAPDREGTPSLADNGEGQVIEGELVEKTADGIYLLVPSAVREPGFRIETFHQRVLVPRSEIHSLSRKQLDRTRTALLIGAGGVVLAAAVVELFGGGLGGNDPPIDDGGPAELRFPVVRLPAR